MAVRSSSLFHFTKSSEILKQILSHGFWPRYCLEDVSWMGVDGLEYVAFPMVCFCDIPMTRIGEHVDFYGSYGIGMSQDWAQRNSLNPLLYMQGNNHLHGAINDLISAVIGKESSDEEERNSMRYLLAHTKALSGKMRVGTEFIEKKFYQESEWRYVPKVEGVEHFLTHDEFQDEDEVKVAQESSRKHAMMKFAPNDVRYIFVPRDSDIPDIVNFIQTSMDAYSAADLKILMARITSLESITYDL